MMDESKAADGNAPPVTPATFSRLRLVGALEGVSFLLLLGVAVPLKYFADVPLAVRVLGPIHGLLFVWLAIEVSQLFFLGVWSITRCALVFGASLVPFGPFLVDGSVKRWGAEATGAAEA